MVIANGIICGADNKSCEGKNCTVGSITNNDARELKIPLTFLTPGKKYEAGIYYDDANSKVRTKVSTRRIQVDASTIIDAKMIASGGQAMWIRPIK